MICLGSHSLSPSEIVQSQKNEATGPFARASLQSCGAGLFAPFVGLVASLAGRVPASCGTSPALAHRPHLHQSAPPLRMVGTRAWVGVLTAGLHLAWEAEVPSLAWFVKRGGKRTPHFLSPS